MSSEITTIVGGIRRLLAYPELKDNAKLLGEINALQDRARELIQNLADCERKVRALERQNQELEALLKMKGELHPAQGVYWKKGSEFPFCPKCFEGEDRRCTMHPTTQMTLGIPQWICSQCDFRLERKENPPELP